VLPWRQTRVFKQAKKALGLQSRRDGFGRDGMWYWSLPTQPHRVPQTRVDPLAQVPERDVGTAVYGRGHSRQPSRIPGPVPRLARTRPCTVMRSDWATIEIDGVQHIVHSIHGRGGRAERAADLGWDTLALFGLSEGRRHGRLWGGSTSCEYLVLCALQVT
jgi:hypothetical protein